MQLSNLGRGLHESPTRKMFNLAARMEQVIDFSLGEPDFVSAQPIIDQAVAAWANGKTHYTSNAGILPLREAIASHHQARLPADPECQILVTGGATEALQLSLLTLVNPGEEVIILTPQWPNYISQVQMIGAVPVCVATREANGFMPDVADVERAITDKTRLIMINTPSNPTGAVIDRQTTDALAELVRRHRLFVITDEVYRAIIYGDQSCPSLVEYPDLRDQTVYIDGFSKMFAMTGWRLGYAISSPEIIRAMTILHENGISNLPEPSQLAAAYALQHCLPEVEKMRAQYEIRRDFVFDTVNNIPGFSMIKPRGAFYGFINISQLPLESEDYCMRLLTEEQVAVVPGSGFGPGGEGFIRISYASSLEKLARGFERIASFNERLLAADN